MEKKKKIKERITGDVSTSLSAIREGRSQGKSLDSPEVCESIRKLAKKIASIMYTELKFSEKFELGDKMCAEVLKEGTLVDDMMDFCLQHKGKLPVIAPGVDVIWRFFMNGTMFSPDLSRKISGKVGFLSYGKDVLESLYDLYVNKKTIRNQVHTLDSISTTTHNMCTFCDVTISDVRAAGFLAVYLKYLKHEAVKNDFVKGVPILTAASDIMNENDASIAGNRLDVEYMIRGIEEAIQSPSGQSHGWFAFELGKIIGNLAIFDSNKKQLVKYGVLPPLVKLAKQPEEIEQITATKALAHLAFDDDNKKTMVSDIQTDVVTTLFDLARSSRYPDVKESAKGVLWTLSEQLHSSTKHADLVQDLFGKKTKGHVMISYSREQRPLLLRIKQAITEAGFSVWMDIEQMRENVYDRMAEAIQDASVVLISMSYSYQRSEYCRREAAYASSLKRARIPLLVDPGYTAEGWLALMTAGDYHYDFVRKPFETKIVELIKELERRCLKGQGEMSDGVVKQEVVSQQSSQVVVSSQGYPSAPCAHGEYSTSRPTNAAHSSKRAEMIKKFLALNKEQFNVWLEKQNLPRDVFESYRANDVVFLAQMKDEAPEGYYKHVMKISKSKNKMEALQLAADFTKALDHLEISEDDS